MMTPAERMKVMQERLSAAFKPSHLKIQDDSHLHVGHAGAAGGAGHYTVVIQSDVFQHKARVNIHREIYKVLEDLIPHEVHALRIKIGEK